MYNLNKQPFDYQAKLKQMEQMKKRKLAEQRKRDRQQAIIFLVAVALFIIGIIAFAINRNNDSLPDLPKNSSVDVSSTEKNTDNIDKNRSESSQDETKHKIEEIDGITYVDGIMIVNKTYSLPKDYAPQLEEHVLTAFKDMQNAASKDGINLYIQSGFRSYQDQEYLYNKYVTERGTKAADEVSARPGHSEHQSGLTMDVNSTEFSFADTPEGKWLAEHCMEYGFIIRFPKGKEEITGFDYEPWHIRYVGVEIAKDITEKGLCLEEYLGVDSKYKD